MTKADRRVKKTRQALQAALIELILEKGYEAITVQDVLNRANVGRSTFYAHFYDLDDLLQSEFEVLQAELEQHLAKHPFGTTIWDLSHLLFHHAQGYQHLYKVVVGKTSGQIIQSNFYRYVSTQMRLRLVTDYGSITHKLLTLDILQHHLVSSLMDLMRFWLDKNLPYSAAEMAQIYQALVKASLDNACAASLSEQA
jgi:AcrR family transcriptional regulator